MTLSHFRKTTTAYTGTCRYGNNIKITFKVKNESMQREKHICLCFRWGTCTFSQCQSCRNQAHRYSAHPTYSLIEPGARVRQKFQRLLLSTHFARGTDVELILNGNKWGSKADLGVVNGNVEEC